MSGPAAIEVLGNELWGNQPVLSGDGGTVIVQQYIDGRCTYGKPLVTYRWDGLNWAAVGSA